ncbi:MAG: hypothetical protein WB783_12085 [Arenicellales bacterium]
MLELTTPTVRSDQRLAAEFRPRKLEPWLARLPRTDSGTHAKWLYKALSAQNRIAIEAAIRLQLMELYDGPFQEFQTSHESDLKAIATIPLHPHYRAKQKDMLGLLDALATGYKIAVVDLASRRRSHNRRGDLALALQRAMYYIGRVILAASEVYLRAPSGSWRELHELYRCAENEGLCETPVQAVEQPGATQNVLQTYLRILLLGASDPLSLLPGEAGRLHELAPQWCDVMKIMRGGELAPTPELAGPGSPQPGHFRIKLSSDMPPLPLSKLPRSAAGRDDDEVRVLRTLAVARAMHEALMSFEDPFSRDAMEVELTMGIEPADVELLRRAGRVLGEVGIRRGSGRFAAEQMLELIVGFDSVCEACKGDASVRTPGEWRPEEDAAGEQFIDLSEPLLGVPIDDSDALDQWGASGTHARPPHKPQSRHARVDNESAEGLCLVVPRSSDLWLKVGDIGACRFPDSSRWQPAVVRWMRVGSKEIRFGVQFLSPLAMSLTAVGDDATEDPEGRSEPVVVPAIWLPESTSLKRPSSIVLPRRAQPYPTSLRLVDGEATPLSVRLLARLERTTSYEQFVVSPGPADAASQSSFSS